MHENWLAILEISKGPLIGGKNFKTRIFYSEIWILLKKLAEESAFVFFIFSRVLRDSTPRYVGRSVGRSVRPLESRFQLLPLPSYHNAPTHPHATDAAVYTALFS